MFWRKKSPSPTNYYFPSEPAEPPKPILKRYTEGQGASNLRFAGGTKESSGEAPGPVQLRQPQQARSSPREEDTTRRVQPTKPAPLVVVSSYDASEAPRTPTSSQFQERARRDYSPNGDSYPHMRTPSSRRSSRHASPITSSFGDRMRANSRPSSPYDTSPSVYTPPQSYFPMSAGYATPPTQCSPSSSVAVITPPSPYRPTNERYGQQSPAFLERLPVLGYGSLPVEEEDDGHDSDVPMLNIIPATPQDQSDGFSAKIDVKRNLNESIMIEEATRQMVEVSLADDVQEHSWQRQSPSERVPTIDLDFNFAPLESLMDFTPSSSTMVYEADVPMFTEEPEYYDDSWETKEESVTSHGTPPSEPLPPSPPFQSYPSLHSFESHEQDDSPATTSSSGMSSYPSFPDVEEALGSMLASLSDSSMATTTTIHTPKGQNVEFEDEMGYDLYESESSQSTAPLSISPSRPTRSPTRSRHTSHVNSKYDQRLQSPPSLRKHRIAYFPNARIHPNSSPSGIFTTVSPSTSGSTVSTNAVHEFETTPTPRVVIIPSVSDSELVQMHEERQMHSKNCRDSLSSDFSDEELCTASIMSVTPVVMQGRLSTKFESAEASKEIVFGGHFAKEKTDMRLGLGLGLEVERDDVGLAL